MSQLTLDDDELFSEAASEVRADVEGSLEQAREALPEPETVWEADADNVLGVLNGLRSAVDTDDATSHLRDAKKWYTMGEKADAFSEDETDLAEAIEDLATVISELEAVQTQVSELTATIPELKSRLEALEASASGEDETATAGESGQEDETTDVDQGETDPETDNADSGEGEAEPVEA